MRPPPRCTLPVLSDGIKSYVREVEYRHREASRADFQLPARRFV